MKAVLSWGASAMADHTIVKVTRDLFAFWKPATLKTEYGPAIEQRLSDEDRHKMGGEKTAYFYGEMKDGRWFLYNRAPRQSW